METNLEVLRQKSAPTTFEECEKSSLFDKLGRELSLNRTGVGLAAIQIGIPLRACLIHYRDPDPAKQELHLRMINPEIEEQSDPIRFNGEGCLSLPGVKVDTDRYTHVKASWLDYDTRTRRTGVFYGTEAIIVQHELDHMNGVLIVDRIAKPSVKVGRNDPCPCGSGRKHKKCCGGN